MSGTLLLILFVLVFSIVSQILRTIISEGLLLCVSLKTERHRSLFLLPYLLTSHLSSYELFFPSQLVIWLYLLLLSQPFSNIQKNTFRVDASTAFFPYLEKLPLSKTYEITIFIGEIRGMRQETDQENTFQELQL